VIQPLGFAPSTSSGHAARDSRGGCPYASFLVLRRLNFAFWLRQRLGGLGRIGGRGRRRRCGRRLANLDALVLVGDHDMG